MGTNATTALQNEIKRLLKIIGWSQKKLGAEIYDDQNIVEMADEKSKMEEGVKRSLSRTSTKKETLEGYLNFITSHEDYIKTNNIAPLYVSTDVLPPELEEEIKKISASINKIFLNNKKS